MKSKTNENISTSETVSKDGSVLFRVLVQSHAQDMGMDDKELFGGFADDEKQVGSVGGLMSVKLQFNPNPAD
jgi:hypothetical protein